MSKRQISHDDPEAKKQKFNELPQSQVSPYNVIKPDIQILYKDGKICGMLDYGSLYPSVTRDYQEPPMTEDQANLVNRQIRVMDGLLNMLNRIDKMNARANMIPIKDEPGS